MIAFNGSATNNLLSASNWHSLAPFIRGLGRPGSQQRPSYRRFLV